MKYSLHLLWLQSKRLTCIKNNKKFNMWFTMITFILISVAIVTSKECYSNQCCRDGRDGIRGQNGADGINGRDGRNGRNGVDGVNGKDGRNGIDGVNGTQGLPGVPGKDGKDAVRNWKQCAWKNLNDPKDNGVIKDCAFKKKNVDTFLKIVAASNMRLHNCDACCKRWFITVNGQECNPVPIDGIVYMRFGTGSQQKDLHRPRVIRGVCRVHDTGIFKIALNVGNCEGFGDADAHTGHSSSTNIYIEELDPPQV